MSTLRRFQIDPKNLLNTALSMYRSKRIKTVVVEGICDKRFLTQWIAADAAIRFDGFDGKPLVERAFLTSAKPPYAAHDFLYFFADVDFDKISNKTLHNHPAFVYNAFCFEQNRLLFNDLESYLINTAALEKLLANFDLPPDTAASLRSRLEAASRRIGAYRAADIIVQREQKLTSSVLNGLEVRAFFSARDISVDTTKLKKSLPNWSNYKHHVDDLVAVAERLEQESPSLWSLTRGHDVTEMLALYLEEVTNHRGITAEKIEMMLRLGCEFREFENSPMAKRIRAVTANTWFAPTN